MNDGMDHDSRLGAQLAELRAALRDLRAPDDEATLLAAAALRRRAHDTGGFVARRVLRWRAPLAAAAGIAVAAMAVVLAVGRDSAVPSRGAASVVPPASLATPAPVDSPALAASLIASPAEQAFQPLLYSPGFSPSASYNVVRVRIPLEALAPGQAAGAGRAIEADLLVGEDGLARGIRFDSADTLFVSTVSR